MHCLVRIIRACHDYWILEPLLLGGKKFSGKQTSEYKQ